MAASLRQATLLHDEALAEAAKALCEGGANSLAIIDDGHDRGLVLKTALEQCRFARSIDATKLSGWLPSGADKISLLSNIDSSGDVRSKAADTVLLGRIYLDSFRDSKLQSPLTVSRACRDILAERRFTASLPMADELAELSPDQQPYEVEIKLLQRMWHEYFQPQQVEKKAQLDSFAASLSGPVARIRWKDSEPEILRHFLDAAASHQTVTEIKIKANERTCELDRLWSEGQAAENNQIKPPSACHTDTLEEAAQAALAQLCAWLDANNGRIGVIAFDRNLARRLHSLCLAHNINLVDRTGWIASNMLVGDTLLAMASSMDGGRDIRLRLQQLLALNRSGHHGKKINRSELTVDDPDMLANNKELFTACQKLGGKQPLAQWFASLAELALQAPLADYFTDDFAAIRLQKLLNQLAGQFAADDKCRSVPMNVLEARSLLLDALNSTKLLASEVSSDIQLVSPWRFSSDKFSSILLLGANAYNLPTLEQGGIFGDEIRSALGMPTGNEINAEKRLALANQFAMHDEIAAVWHGDTAISPYLELLRPNMLQPPRPSWSAKDAASRLISRHSARVKALPEILSASSLDTLMDCPYRFYANGILKLNDNQTNRDFRSSEFGSYVHEVLKLFHESLDTNKDLMPQLHEAIESSLKIIPSNLRLSLYRMLLLPVLTCYARKMQNLSDEGGRIECVEQRNQEEIITKNGWFTLICKADRVDSYANGKKSVVDIKTGAIKLKDVAAGEKPQLALYSRSFGADDELTAIWQIKSERGETTINILKPFEKSLHSPKEISAHIFRILEEMDTEPLPANGEQSICSICSFAGLCRKPHWQQAQ